MRGAKRGAKYKPRGRGLGQRDIKNSHHTNIALHLNIITLIEIMLKYLPRSERERERERE